MLYRKTAPSIQDTFGENAYGYIRNKTAIAEFPECLFLLASYSEDIALRLSGVVPDVKMPGHVYTAISLRQYATIARSIHLGKQEKKGTP